MTMFGVLPTGQFKPPSRGHNIIHELRRQWAAEERRRQDKEATKLAEIEHVNDVRRAACERLVNRKIRVSPTADIRRIQQQTADEFGLTVAEMLSGSLVPELVHARDKAMWRCREETRHSLTEIGRQFNHRDHSTISRCRRRYERRILGNAQPPDPSRSR